MTATENGLSKHKNDYTLDIFSNIELTVCVVAATLKMNTDNQHISQNLTIFHEISCHLKSLIKMPTAMSLKNAKL